MRHWSFYTRGPLRNSKEMPLSHSPPEEDHMKKTPLAASQGPLKTPEEGRISIFRATPFRKLTAPFCRFPLPTLIYGPKVSNLGDLLRLLVRASEKLVEKEEERLSEHPPDFCKPEEHPSLLSSFAPPQFVTFAFHG